MKIFKIELTITEGDYAVLLGLMQCAEEDEVLTEPFTIKKIGETEI